MLYKIGLLLTIDQDDGSDIRDLVLSRLLIFLVVSIDCSESVLYQ